MNNSSLKKIWAMSHQLNMKSDDLHLLCKAVTGSDSLKELTGAQSSALIGELSTRLGGKKNRSARKYETSGMTQAQCGKAFALIYVLEKYDEVPSAASEGERLSGVIRKAIGKLSGASQPFSRLNVEDGIKLIETLNRYIVSAERRRSNEKNA
ncbi:MAG: DUF1018 domain-containing protein [Oscillospiraceae bacterium]|nr:DUF1018 domain-containing protein [Oscillospiraceae bacterium]